MANDTNGLIVREGGSANGCTTLRILSGGALAIDPGATITQGVFSSTGVAGVAVNPANTAGMRVYGDDAGAALTPTGAVPDLKTIAGRYLVTAGQNAVHARVWGVQGLAKIYNALFSEEQIGGVNGRFEAVQAAAGTTTLAGYGVSSGVCGIFATAGTTLVNTNHIAAGVSAIADIKGTCTQTGRVVAFYAGIYDTSQWSDATARAAWGIGLYIPRGAATQGIRIGNWAGTGSLGSAVVFSGATDSADTSQLDLLAVYGESASDLTNAVSVKCARFRHLVNATTIAHESYGVVGQLVVKSTLLNHLHAGVMGTFECNTACTVPPGNLLGAAAVMARIGGATITVAATGVLAGVLSTSNATVVSVASGGVYAAFACRKVGSGIRFEQALHIEDALVALSFKAAASGYDHGVAAKTGTLSSQTAHAIKVMVGTTPGYIPVYAADTW